MKLPFDSNFDLAPPSLVIHKILDDAANRTFYQATNEFGLIGGHLYWHTSVAKEIDDYVKRWLETELRLAQRLSKADSQAEGSQNASGDPKRKANT